MRLPNYAKSIVCFFSFEIDKKCVFSLLITPNAKKDKFGKLYLGNVIWDNRVWISYSPN